MQTNTEEITAFQLAQLAVQLDPKNPENAFDRATNLFRLAGKHIETEGDFVLRVEKSLRAGLPSEAELEKMVSFKTGQSLPIDPESEFYTLLLSLLKSNGVAKFGQGKQNAPTTDDIRGKLRILSKVASAAADGAALPMIFARVAGACGPVLFEKVAGKLKKAPWYVVFSVPGKAGKGPIKGSYNLPVWAAYAVQRIWEIPEPPVTPITNSMAHQVKSKKLKRPRQQRS